MKTMKKQAKRCLAVVLACLMLLSMGTVMASEEEGMSLYSATINSDTFNNMNLTADLTELAVGTYKKALYKNDADLIMKYDATKGNQTFKDNSQTITGKRVLVADTTADSGAYVEVDFRQVLTGQVTISFQAVGGQDANVAARWEVLDDLGNVIIQGGQGNNHTYGTSNAFECAYCANGIHAEGAHKKTVGGAPIVQDYVSTSNAINANNGWYKMHLNFDTGFATFEEKGRVSADAETWKVFRGYYDNYEVTEATSAEYVMALASTRGARKIRFNCSGSATPTTKFVISDIEVAQTAFGQLTAEFDVENGGNVAVGEPLKVNFNYPVDAATLESNITLTKGGETVAAAVTPSATGATVTPATNLKPGNYTLTVGTGVKAAGNAYGLATPATVNFNVVFEEPELYTLTESFLGNGTTNYIVPDATLQDGYYQMRNDDNSATIKMKLDSGLTWGGDAYKIQGQGGDGFKAWTTAGGGAHMIYEFDKTLTGKVTLSFCVYGGTNNGHVNTGNRWELLDGEGNTIIVGGNGGNSTLGSSTTMYCVKENCKGHKDANGNNATGSYLYNNGSTRNNGWYKMHLDFEAGTVTFERTTDTSGGWTGIADNKWEPFYGSAGAAVAANSDLYTMSLGGAQGLKALKFNFASSNTSTYIVDEIKVEQTALGRLTPNFAVPATDVHPDQPLHINFNHKVDTTTLNGNVTLTKAGDVTATPITIQPSYDGTDVVVKPDASLTPGATYTLAVAGGAVFSTESAIYPATAASTTFTVGADVGYFKEDNFNNVTYSADIHNSAALLLSNPKNRVMLGGNIYLDNDAALKNTLTATSGAFLTEDGRLHITRNDSWMKYFVDIPNVSQGNLKITADVELNGTYGNGDGWIYTKDSQSYAGDATRYFTIGGSTESTMPLTAYAQGGTSSAFGWGSAPTTKIGHDVVTNENHNYMKPGKYNITFDCNLDNGSAVVTIKNHRAHGIWTGVANVSNMLLNEDNPAHTMLAFYIPVGGEMYLDNITMRYTPPTHGLMRVTNLATKKAGTSVDSIVANDEITISARLTNDVRTAANVQLYAAIYSTNDELLYVIPSVATTVASSTDAGRDASGSTTVSVDLTVPADVPTGSYIKTFAWTTDLQPVTNVLNSIPKAQ